MIVIDSNIFIAALMRNSHIRHILIFSKKQFAFPEIMLEEIKKYKELILAKSKMDEKTYEKLLPYLCSKIIIVPTDQFSKYLDEAKKIMKKIDIKDAPFIATALSYGDASIWSDDIHFKQQDKIKSYNTKELTKLFQN